VVPDDAEGMTTLFHVTGGYTYIDPYGVALGYEDVFTTLEVESGCGAVAVGWACLFPPLSSGGALVAQP
jgi:hypothetical protein